MSIQACMNFGESMSAMAEGMKGMPNEAYHRQMFAEAAKVIEWLICELDTVARTQNAENQTLTTHRETKEGENEKRDIPPTPPIESKAKEEAKKETTNTNTHTGACAGTRVGACVCTREDVLKINREADELFDAFWSKYPAGHRNNKKECRKKMRSLYQTAHSIGKAAQFINAMLDGLERWRKSRRWAEGYVVHPTTFLNQERWMEFPEESVEESYEQKAEAEKKVNDDCEETLKRLGL